MKIDIPEGYNEKHFIVLMHVAIRKLRGMVGSTNAEHNVRMIRLAKSFIRQAHEQSVEAETTSQIEKIRNSR